MTIYITEEEVGRLTNMDDAIAAVDDVGRSMSAGETIFVPRTRLRMSGGFLHLMPASMEKEGVFGYKAYTSFKGKVRFFVHLFDNQTGDLLAIIEADKLGQLRTGAASGAATRILARPKAATLGLIGSGYQAESQLTAALAVRSFGSVKVFSRNYNHAKAFCEKMQKLCKPGLEAVKDVSDAAGCDVVTTVTSADSPVLFGEMLKEGCHINAAGGNTLVKRELDELAIRRADVIVIDSREQGEKECGDFLPLLEKGKLHWNDIYEFGDLFSGAAARKTDAEITLFKSQGIGPWDVALARIVYQRALEQKVGVNLPL
ncbi:MAG TPA: ornithine cyclodeaminase family protein [Candidatus Kryptobacter bacterium]|nr:ornithine cyclodeaminase family protein [Candidatus Kryptobacter bacterium]